MMLWMNWLPWRFVIRRLARSHGFLDPMALLAKLRGFAQPSEVGEPVELLRAGAVFHARGLINSKVIQHNLDWVWPYWIERQFDPRDDAFVPRAFSITHVNLTHRNWTAIGLPDCTELPIVDPRGLLTPFYDAWSVDAWLLTDDGRCLLPSRSPSTTQRLDYSQGLAVVTETRQDSLVLHNRAWVEANSASATCTSQLEAESDADGWLVLALRPYNPEGISFIHEVALSPTRTAWTIDKDRTVEFSAPADRHHVSDYRAGDVYIHLQDLDDQHRGKCDVGMVTAAAMFRLESGTPRTVVTSTNLAEERQQPGAAVVHWPDALAGHCQLDIPDERVQVLYDTALRTLVLHSPGDVYPGPYTYKRFWFRDAAFIIHALLCAGFTQRAERALQRFPARQGLRGYFHSQEGEWDANGEALWILQRYCQLTGKTPEPEWQRMIDRGARWIVRKRLAEDLDAPHAGLLPAGFSAEHLGPNDYYYWDDFWSIAGLHSASDMCAQLGEHGLSDEYRREAESFRRAVDDSLAGASERLKRPAMPASPYRRMDAGAIGSLATGYPLQLCQSDDPRLLDTIEYLLDYCFFDNGFFQDMIHSGINPYLTLHVAQVLLRAGDPRYLDLMDAVAGFASPTGQWPEAIHPRTGGGCMGDGQHVWAAAEWILMIRNCFVREENDTLILCAGVPPRWLEGGREVRFGPAPTTFGTLTVTLTCNQAADRVTVGWHATAWHTEAPPIKVCLPGFQPVTASAGSLSVELSRISV